MPDIFLGYADDKPQVGHRQLLAGLFDFFVYNIEFMLERVIIIVNLRCKLNITVLNNYLLYLIPG
jgi:hypothetical protein